MDRDVNSREFLEQLHELQHKLQFVKAQEFKDAKATADVHDVMENLKFKAMEKIREWLLMKISLFRKPLANYQIPQNALLKNRFFYEFLLANDRQVAREVRDDYVDSIGKMFYSYFKTYASRLFKLQLSDSACKEDLLGAEDTVKSAGFFSSKPHVRNRATVFSLGNRDALLNVDLSVPLIVPHAAQQANERFQFETLFRSLQYALVDHSSHEYLFICDFFLVSDETARDLFGQVMGRAIAHIQRTIEEYVAGNYDAISFFLCIRLCQKYAALMVERGVPAMDSYWDSTCTSLWSRLEAVMQAHTDSVRMVDVKRLMPIDTRPHYIIRRYAEFTCAFLAASELPDGEPLDNRLQRLLTKQQSEIEQLLARMSSQLSNKKERLVCLINNYDLILNTITERVTSATHEKTSFWELQQTTSARYVDEVLTPYFGELIAFVAECEPLIEQGHTQLLQRSAAKVTQMVRSFGADWKKSIDLINKEIVRSFTNFKNGTNFQSAFTQLIQLHQRFQKILAHEAFADCPARNELVNIHHIMLELKKYKPVY